MSNRISRKSALPLAEVFKMMIREGHASATHNSHRIYAAWDAASGAAPFTIRRYFRDGKLYITLSSSVICSQLSMQRDALLEKINAIVSGDDLFISDGSGEDAVKELILK
jgi:hypothetical protein